MVFALATGCSQDRSEAQNSTWRVERDTVGDTVVVRTISGSVWGRPATLVEELAIGTLEGQEELMFGFVQEIAPDPYGGVYVFDAQVPALRYYDASGEYVRTLGGEGSGPGEYRDVALGLALRSDGRVVMRDPRNARLNVYEPDGTPAEHWSVASGLFTSNALTVDTADHMFLKILLEPPERNRPWKIGLLHLDENGELVDTIPDPKIGGESITEEGVFLPQKVWALSRLGDMAVGVNSDYAFEVRRRDGQVIRIEKVHTPVEVHPDERAELEAENEWRRQNYADELPTVPTTKPAYRDLYTGERGRIWVHLYTRAEKVEVVHEQRNPNRPPPRSWSEPRVFDVWERDGTYLGVVRVPPRTALSVFRGDSVWGIRRGELDEQYIVRFRIDHEPGA